MGRPSITLTSAEETGIWNYKLWLNIEVALLAVLIIGVWGLLSLPIIFYHLPISEVRFMQGLQEQTFIMLVKWVLAIFKAYCSK